MDVDNTTFPNNIVIALADSLAAISPPDEELGDPGVPVFRRPLRKGDPVQAIGVSAGMWVPDEDSFEMAGQMSHAGATINNYVIAVQTFVQHMDEQMGLALSATLAGAVRNKIMLSAGGGGPLAGLSSSEFGYMETVRRARIQTQRFISNEIQGQFLYLANLELRVETEIRNL